MTKRSKKNKKDELDIKWDGNLKKVIIMILIVFIFLGVFYLITVKITDNDTKEDTDEEVVDIQTEEILVGSSFNRSSKEYIVIYYDKANSDLASISNKVYEYRNKSERLPLYEADMSNIFNKEYSTDKEVNKNPKDISELMINGPTLIKFSNNEVTTFIEGVDNILNYLG